MKPVVINKVKYIPKQNRITIPGTENLNSNTVEVVEKKDFTQEHADRIVAFWKDLQTRDAAFDANQAVRTTFVQVEASDEDLLGSESDDEVVETDVYKMLKGDLQKFLSSKQIAYDQDATKADLLELANAWIISHPAE